MGWKKKIAGRIKTEAILAHWYELTLTSLFHIHLNVVWELLYKEPVRMPFKIKSRLGEHNKIQIVLIKKQNRFREKICHKW